MPIVDLALTAENLYDKAAVEGFEALSQTWAREHVGTEVESVPALPQEPLAAKRWRLKRKCAAAGVCLSTFKGRQVRKLDSQFQSLLKATFLKAEQALHHLNLVKEGRVVVELESGWAGLRCRVSPRLLILCAHLVTILETNAVHLSCS